MKMSWSDFMAQASSMQRDIERYARPRRDLDRLAEFFFSPENGFLHQSKSHYLEWNGDRRVPTGMDYSVSQLNALDLVRQMNLVTGNRLKETAMTTTADVKPITNPAIKLLVDDLNRKKAVRLSKTNLITHYEEQIAQAKKEIASYGEQIEADDKNISALTKALKKLGHTVEK